jgi:hypothetical protein
MFGDWLAKLNFTNGMAIISTSLGVILTLGVFLMARRMVGHPKSDQGTPSDGASNEETFHDPFIHGSVDEKRIALRRAGSPMTVSVSDEIAAASPWTGLITDRSLGGVRVLQEDYVPVGTTLSVRSGRASESAPWTQVEVRHCRKTDAGWELGCTFVRTPTSSVLVDFG